MSETIQAGVFDLDGTLYFSEPLSREIGRAAALYISRLKGMEQADATELIRATRKRLTVEQGREASLSVVCLALGGDLQGLHRCFSDEIVPEPMLVRDGRVVELLERMGSCFPLYLYTNNNRTLTARIMDAIGVSHLFARVFTIEDGWLPKPDRTVLDSIMTEIGKSPSECLFVGDRYDIDLRLPQELGATVQLVGRVEELLALDRYLQ